MRLVVADNVERLMESFFANKPEVSNRPLYLAKEAEVSLSTIQRTLSKETGCSIDTLEALAGVFGVSASDLLVPSEGLQKRLGITPEQRARGVVTDFEANLRRKKSPA